MNIINDFRSSCHGARIDCRVELPFGVSDAVIMTCSTCKKHCTPIEAKKEDARCKLCGEPMPPGEEMFYYHGYSGDCPKPPLKEAPAPRPMEGWGAKQEWEKRFNARFGHMHDDAIPFIAAELAKKDEEIKDWMELVKIKNEEIESLEESSENDIASFAAELIGEIEKRRVSLMHETPHDEISQSLHNVAQATLDEILSLIKSKLPPKE